MAQEVSREMMRGWNRRMRRVATRARRAYEADPGRYAARVVRVEWNLRVIRERVRAFGESNGGEPAAQAVRFLDDALWWRAASRDSGSGWLLWVAAAGFGDRARRVLLQHYPPQVVDALFEPDHRAVLWGRRAIADHVSALP